MRLKPGILAKEFRDRVKAVNPDAYIVGEIWTEAVQWLDGTQFDGVLNYPFTSATLAFAAGDRVRMDLVEIPHYFPYPALDAEGYASKIDHLLKLYPWDIQLTQTEPALQSRCGQGVVCGE